MEQISAAAADVDREVARLGGALLARADALAQEMANRIQAAVPIYAMGLVSTAELSETCRDNVEFIFGALGGSVAASVSSSRDNGRARARVGIPLPAVMAAYRVAARYLWNELAAEACRSMVRADVITSAATAMWLVLDVYTNDMADGYRDEITAQTVLREQQRSSLVAAILQGELVDTSLWEAAEILRLPTEGPYVVTAAAIAEPGRIARPLIASRLHAVGIASAWGVTHDSEVGIVTVQGGRTDIDQLERELAGSHAGSAGISPAFSALSDSPEALRLARIALRASTSNRPVTVFDRHPLPVAAVAAPDVMQILANATLSGLDGLSEDNRRTLLDTLGAWLASGGSAERAADQLYCHPNTIRYRMRRLAHYTGFDLEDPLSMAQVVLAYHSYFAAKA